MGVDIFFVLSGYLITSLLLDQDRPPGNLAGFWGRRARRLLPAVLVLLAALSLYAWAGGAGLVPAQLRAPALATLLVVALGITWAVLVVLTPFTLRVQIAGFIPVTVGVMLALGGSLIVAAAVWLNINAVIPLARSGGVPSRPSPCRTGRDEGYCPGSEKLPRFESHRSARSTADRQT